jgi:hypothetical protein
VFSGPNMPHKPTLMSAIIVVLVLFLLYHFLIAKKR